MPDFDLRYDTTPQNTMTQQRGAQISVMKAALSAYNSTSYTAARLQTMSRLDLRSACRLHGLTVAGL